MKTQELTAEEIREVLDYDPETGIFTWVKDLKYKKRKGLRAGSVGRLGYRFICYKQIRMLEHRVAWLHVYGKWPSQHIDHINGVITDNRVCNLRDVPQRVNQQNIRKVRSDSKSGVQGVRRTESGRYSALIKVDGRQIYLGVHESAEKAHAVYLQAKRQAHAGFAG